MTLDERRMAVAYADLVSIKDAIQHIYRVEAYGLLSDRKKRRLIEAERCIEDVSGEVQKYMSEHTEWNEDEEEK